MIDIETCEAWLRSERARARRNSVARLIATAGAAVFVLVLQFTALALAIHYFAALALVRLINLPPEDPVNRMVVAIAGWGWSIEECASAVLALFVLGYLAVRWRVYRDRPALVHTDDTGEPAMTVPQFSRSPVRSDLTRAVPNALHHAAAIAFALPRLAGKLLTEAAYIWRLQTIRTRPCATVVAQLFGRGQVELTELEVAVGKETLARALPQLWEFPGVQFLSGEKDALALGPVATDHLLGFGVA